MTDNTVGPQSSYIYGHITSVEETIRIKEVWKEGVIAEDERSRIFYLLRVPWFVYCPSSDRCVPVIRLVAAVFSVTISE